VLFDNRCLNCNAQDKFISVMEYVAALNVWMTQVETLVIAAILLLAVFMSNNLSELSAAIGAGAGLMGIYVWLRRRYKPFIDRYRLQSVLAKQSAEIMKGLYADLRHSVEDINADRPKESYEKLREIGHFLRNEPIKTHKIMCLNRFIIRKDMELELESIVPKSFDRDFIAYLLEATKVNKQLVRQTVLDYLSLYRDKIEELDEGREVIALVMGAALRMKKYVELYQHILIDYVDDLPKERMLRLCKMLATDLKEAAAPLYDKCKDTAKMRYGLDPDFQSIF
jgi:hypothetical protein